MKQKFAKFYNSVKNFVIDTNLSKPDEVVGAEVKTIENLETELGIKLPDFLFSFFECFGEEIIVKGVDQSLNFAIKDFKYANSKATEENIISILSDSEGLKDYYGDGSIWHVSDMMNLDNVLILNYSSLGRRYSFIDSTIENPNLLFIYQKKYFERAEIDFIGGNVSFTNYIRTVLFDLVKEEFRKINEGKDVADGNSLQNYESVLSINKLKWAEYYSHFPKNKDLFFYAGKEFRQLRGEFYLLASKKETENDTILTIDEFELSFIDFLKERNFNTSE
ncbi:hypothetical protein [Emticicia sp. 17c]|uniref:hypothetical protein n=1 Tax=Emticicia sp. 17c TaxID=3127704 RepID=UPI00301C0DDF